MWRVVSLVAVLAGVFIAAPSSRADTGDDFTRTPLAVDVTVGPDDDTTCRVVADLYRPVGATSEQPVPAILTTHGFGGSKDDDSQRAIGASFAREGYAVLSYSGLGFGGSGCKIYLDDRQWDGKAGSQLVDLLAGRTFHDHVSGQDLTLDFVQLDAPGDPRVGMIGGSYGGQIQYAVAAVSKKLDALVPLITWNNLAYSLAPENSSVDGDTTNRVPGVHKKQWTSLFFGAGILDGAGHADVDPTRMAGCPNFHDPVCVAKAKIEATGYPDGSATNLLRKASVASYAEDVQAPTLLIQGQKDTLFNLQEAVATYRQLTQHGTEVAMVWQSWGHSLGGTPVPGELDLQSGTLRSSYLGERIANWFDHWLRGDRSAPVGPRFDYFRDWAYEATGDATGDVSRAYASAGTYPVGRTQRFFLSGSDALTPERSTVRPGNQSFTVPGGNAPTSYSETSALEGDSVNMPPSDTPGTFAGWTSEPLSDDLAVVGAQSLEVSIASPTAQLSQVTDAGRLVLFAKVYDIAPDGTKRLKNRLVSPVRVEDVRDRLRVELPGIVHRFPAGHRIQVVLAAGDAAYAGNPVSHRVTVRTDTQEPGTLSLPVVPARAGHTR